MRFERLGWVTLATLATLLIGLTLAVVLGPGRRLAVADPDSPQVTHSPAEVVVPATPVSGTTVATEPATCATNPHARYVLVSISQQHAWMCSGHQLVYSTAVTTGASADGDQTPTGSWQIQAKQVDRYLTGPGYDDYVKYWLPFWGDFGFHDASWQTFAFGGAQWQTEGSHGCVHLPTP
ncbi:MAG TPA: L,D-transpeptidase, partial [Jatrophihabitantaceae bacterium]|nr:L,D-transpeptidase [Jatrophihabitantaceae bacterium]